MKLIGLDLETANYNYGSICSIGLALVENGVVLDKRECLIRPHQSLDWMLPQFTDVHGIDYYQLRSCPEFGKIWPLMSNFISMGDLVVIQNSPFDLGHLQVALKLYRSRSFAFNYIFSLQLSRQLFPEMTSHSLDQLAVKFGIEFQHHDALDDAITCALIVSQIKISEKSIEKFEFTVPDDTLMQ